MRKLKGDNVAALTLLIKLRPHGPHMAMMMKQLALRLAVLSFPPDAVHTPGVAHVAADRLSRIYSPDRNGKVTCSIHHSLIHAAEVKAPVRTSDWYIAEALGSAAPAADGEEWEPWADY